MDQHRTLVTLSALPLALVGFGALEIAISSATSGFGDPIPWLIVSVAVLASAIGVARGMRWAFVGEGIVGAVLVVVIAVLAVFALQIVNARLENNMFGTPFGVLNGWASMVVCAVGIGAGIWMIAAARLGVRSTRA